MLLHAAAVGALGLRSRDLLAADGHDQVKPVSFKMPPGACDCHVHVFCDPGDYPLATDRSYTPPQAPVSALSEMLDELRIERVVIVSPAIYGTSNDCTLAAIQELGARARGIALLAPQTTSAECERLKLGGIQGLRLNFETLGITDPRVATAQFDWASKLAADHGWHIQINTRLPIVAALEHLVLESNVPVVFDHFAKAQASLGVEQEEFSALVRLLQANRAYVKISAAYQISTQPPHYRDVEPIAQALIAANPKRILWGSNWPHPDTERKPGRRATDLRPPLPVDNVTMLNLLAIWAPDPAIRRLILVDNPERLYGFPTGPDQGAD